MRTLDILNHTSIPLTPSTQTHIPTLLTSVSTQSDTLRTSQTHFMSFALKTHQSRLGLVIQAFSTLPSTHEVAYSTIIPFPT